MRKENVQKTACNLSFHTFVHVLFVSLKTFSRDFFHMFHDKKQVEVKKSDTGGNDPISLILFRWEKNHYLVNECLYSLSIKTDMFLFTTLLQHRNPLFGPSPERPWNSLWLAEDVPDIFLQNSRLLKVARGVIIWQCRCRCCSCCCCCCCCCYCWCCCCFSGLLLDDQYIVICHCMHYICIISLIYHQH